MNIHKIENDEINIFTEIILNDYIILKIFVFVHVVQQVFEKLKKVNDHFIIGIEKFLVQHKGIITKALEKQSK